LKFLPISKLMILGHYTLLLSKKGGLHFYLLFPFFRPGHLLLLLHQHISNTAANFQSKGSSPTSFLHLSL
jgi:hypothetical protein